MSYFLVTGHLVILSSCHTYSSQPRVSSVSPLNRPKNAFCIAVVIGPRLPAPIVMPSTERMGETSAAVPVKNSSSARYSASRGRFC